MKKKPWMKAVILSGYSDVLQHGDKVFNIMATPVEYAFNYSCDNWTLKDLGKFSLVSGTKSADPLSPVSLSCSHCGSDLFQQIFQQQVL